MSQLVDFHSHFFSRAFFDALNAGSPLPGEPEVRLQGVAARAQIELPPDDPCLLAERWIQDMDSHGVGHMVTFASLTSEAESVLKGVQHGAGRLTGFVVLDPTQKDIGKKLEGLFGTGNFKGALFFPALHGYRADGPEMQGLLEQLSAFKTLIVVHCGLLRIGLRDAFGLPKHYAIHKANPLHLIPVADRHPGLNFIIPHFGAGFFRELLMAGSQCPNIHVDTSSSNNWMDTQPERLTLPDVFERTLSVFGAQRVLFGTDSSTFPRGWRRSVLTSQREALGACGLKEEQRQMVLGGNASRLLGL